MVRLILLRPAPQAYELRGAGAVLHSHSLNAVAATLLDQGGSEFRATHLEMIKVRIRRLPASQLSAARPL